MIDSQTKSWNRVITYFQYIRLKLINKPQIVSITLLCLIAIFVPLITWFREGYIIAGVDYVPSFVAQENLYDTFFIWNSARAGLQLLDPAAINPYLNFWAFFDYINVNIRTTEMLWIITTLILPGLAMYYFSSFLFRRQTSEIPKFIASFFYMINIFNVSSSLLSISTAMILTLLPLLLGVLGRSFEKKDSKYIFIFAICTFLLSSSAVHPPRYIIMWVVVIMFALYYIFFVEKENKRTNIFIFIKSILLTIIINSWWIISFLYSRGSVTAQVTFDRLSTGAQNSDLFSIFRLVGGWWSWDKSFNDSLYYPYSIFYSTPLMIFVTVLIPVLVFSALYLQRTRMVLTIGFFTLVAIFLSKGLHPPLESVNLFLYETIPFFVIFRDPLIYFNSVVTFGYALLLGITSEEIYLIFKRNKNRFSPVLRKTSVIVIILIITASSWGVVSGKIIIDDRGDLPGYYTNIPSYWLEAGEFINTKKGDFKILPLPYTVSDIVHYNWRYYGPDLPQNIFSKSVFGSQSGYIGNSQKEKLELFAEYNVINKNSTTDFARILSILNVRYILQRNDLDWSQFDTYEKSHNQKRIKDFLNLQTGIHFEKTFGELDIYELDENQFLPLIYGTSNIIPLANVSLNGNLESKDFVLQSSLIPKEDEWAYVLEPSQMSTIDNVSYVSLSSEQVWEPSNYIRYMGSLNINPSIYSYLLISFKTNVHTSINIDLITNSGKYHSIYAENPTIQSDGSYYLSEEWYTLIFKLGNVLEPIDIIAIHPNNHLDPEYNGKMEIWIKDIKFVKNIYSEDTLPDIIGLNPKDAAYLTHEDMDKVLSFQNENNSKVRNPESVNVGEPTITFQKINPTQYKVHVNTLTPLMIVFSEPYHTGWKAYQGDLNWFETLWMNPIDDKRHFKINTYANSWYLDSTGEYDLTIYFLPQNIYTFGLIVTSLSFIGSGVYIFFLLVKKIILGR